MKHNTGFDLIYKNLDPETQRKIDRSIIQLEHENNRRRTEQEFDRLQFKNSMIYGFIVTFILIIVSWLFYNNEDIFNIIRIATLVMFTISLWCGAVYIDFQA